MLMMLHSPIADKMLAVNVSVNMFTFVQVIFTILTFLQHVFNQIHITCLLTDLHTGRWRRWWWSHRREARVSTLGSLKPPDNFKGTFPAALDGKSGHLILCLWRQNRHFKPKHLRIWCLNPTTPLSRDNIEHKCEVFNISVRCRNFRNKYSVLKCV